MTFEYITKNSVRSTDGFEIYSMDRFEFLYRNGKDLTIYYEDGYTSDGKFIVIVNQNNFRYWNDGVAIPEDKQEKIYENFRAAIEFQGGKVKIYK